MKYGRLNAKQARERGFGSRSKVIFNGIEIRNCVDFDDENGWVDVLDLDENGQVYFNEEANGASITRHYGDVRYIPEHISQALESFEAHES